MKTSNKILIGFITVFLVFLSMYFIFRNKFGWATQIMPEFVGFSFLAIIITIAMKLNNGLSAFITVLSFIFIFGIFLFLYGWMNNIQFLIDLSPELLGSTLLGAIFSGIFGKKVSGF